MLGLRLLRSMELSGRKTVTTEFETEYLDYTLKGEITSYETTVGDPTVINGTHTVYEFHVEQLTVLEGDQDITEKYKADPRSYEGLKYYFIEAFKLGY